MKHSYVASAGETVVAEDSSYMATRFAALVHARKTKEPVDIRGHDRTETVAPRMATDEEITVVRDAAHRESDGRTINAVSAVAMVGRVN
ncbi:MAG: hypothetical protein ACR2LS_04500 [Thermomicrobiales bacterium]